MNRLLIDDDRRGTLMYRLVRGEGGVAATGHRAPGALRSAGHRSVVMVTPRGAHYLFKLWAKLDIGSRLADICSSSAGINDEAAFRSLLPWISYALGGLSFSARTLMFVRSTSSPAFPGFISLALLRNAPVHPSPNPTECGRDLNVAWFGVNSRGSSVVPAGLARKGAPQTVAALHRVPSPH
ncbi:hypothetical protein SKAU_G00311820 [Synaphobranchus kaupii]|uniref:Uncharacterized protein n=1 Tax=Synaphobranchus kaupii TaxID=118154 RepID=A0A9Q1ERS7_SYNKA|nr:hypothetical protein SKAU_G00311820 [Synaphobranchus kaupii]